MPSRRRIDRKLRDTKKVSRLSDTPKKGTPTKSMRNILTKNSDIMNETASFNKSTSRQRTNSSQKADDVLDVSELLKVNWKVFRVSPIYNFNPNKLKIYARKLKEVLAAFNWKNENSVYNCKFQFKKLLLDEKHDIIQVNFNANGNKYTGYFISPEENQYQEDLGIKHFPMLLVEAGVKILKQVHDVFSKFFDCDIHPVSFPFRALITFFTSMSHMYIDDVPNLASEIVTLHYKIPGCPQSDNIAVAASLAATSTVFVAFSHELGATLTNTQIISCFYDRIINHILNVYKVDLSPAELFKIIFPHFAISSNGWVKLCSEEVVRRTLPIIGEFIKLEHIAKP